MLLRASFWNIFLSQDWENLRIPDWEVQTGPKYRQGFVGAFTSPPDVITETCYCVSVSNIISDALADYLPVVPMTENKGLHKNLLVCPETVYSLQVPVSHHTRPLPPPMWRPRPLEPFPTLALPSSHVVSPLPGSAFLSCSLFHMPPLLPGNSVICARLNDITPAWLLDPCFIFPGTPVLWASSLLMYLLSGTSCLSSGAVGTYCCIPTGACSSRLNLCLCLRYWD